MRVSIIGANGQLGSDLVEAFSRDEVIAWTRHDFDIRDHAKTSAAILSARPDVVINTAAFHKTDACEDHLDLAFAINATAVRNLALTCQAANALLVQISTDYVFDGAKSEPYTEDDAPRPINAYGVSKLAGEHFVAALSPRYYVIRVASLFGAAAARGKGGNFVQTMLNNAARGEEIRVVDDIHMSPTYTVDAALQIRRIVERRPASGIYHVTNTGVCTWYEFAREIFSLIGANARLTPCSITALAPRARRPRCSALTSQRLRTLPLAPLRPWHEALASYLQKESVPVR